jgi:hypothetical protein
LATSASGLVERGRCRRRLCRRQSRNGNHHERGECNDAFHDVSSYRSFDSSSKGTPPTQIGPRPIVRPKSRNRLTQFQPRLHTNAREAVLPSSPDISAPARPQSPVVSRRTERFCMNSYNSVARFIGRGLVLERFSVQLPPIVRNPDCQVARRGPLELGKPAPTGHRQIIAIARCSHPTGRSRELAFICAPCRSLAFPQFSMLVAAVRSTVPPPGTSSNTGRRHR